MEEIKIMTDMERERKKRNSIIIEEFEKLNPKLMAKGYKPYRTIRVIADRHGMTPSGVRYILTTTGTINSLKEVADQTEKTEEKHE